MWIIFGYCNHMNSYKISHMSTLISSGFRTMLEWGRKDKSRKYQYFRDYVVNRKAQKEALKLTKDAQTASHFIHLKQTVRSPPTYKMGTTSILAFLALITLTQATMNMGNLWFTQNSGSDSETESRTLPLSMIESLLMKSALEPNTNLKAIGRGVGKDVLYLKPWWGDFSKWRRSIRFKRNSGTVKIRTICIGKICWNHISL